MTNRSFRFVAFLALLLVLVSGASLASLSPANRGRRHYQKPRRSASRITVCSVVVRAKLITLTSASHCTVTAVEGMKTDTVTINAAISIALNSIGLCSPFGKPSGQDDLKEHRSPYLAA